MTIRRYTLSKAERLSRKRDIDLLFAEGQSFIAYPLRVVYTVTDEQRSVPASILISVSKKKFKRAVKRNAVKRQIRESYRLRKSVLHEPLLTAGKFLTIAFIYLEKELVSYENMEKAMEKAVRMLGEKSNEEVSDKSAAHPNLFL